MVWFSGPVKLETITTYEAAVQLGIPTIQRHILLCADASKPKCCDPALGRLSWDYLKRRLKELGLVGSNGRVFRTKAHCLQICARGPIAVVYPEGVWYHSMTAERIPRLVKDHLVKDCLVEENRIGTYPLSESTPLS